MSRYDTTMNGMTSASCDGREAWSEVYGNLGGVKPNTGGSMFGTMSRDIKTFLIEHRGTIYFLLAALVIDHLFFKDTFRLRLQAMCDALIKRVEDTVKG